MTSRVIDDEISDEKEEYEMLPYMAKRLRGKTSVVFHSIVNLFPRIMALSIGNTSLQACYRESLSANNHFPH